MNIVILNGYTIPYMIGYSIPYLVLGYIVYRIIKSVVKKDKEKYNTIERKIKPIIDVVKDEEKSTTKKKETKEPIKRIQRLYQPR